MDRWLGRVEKGLTYAALVSTCAMVALTSMDAGGRYIFNTPIVGAYEITEKYLLVFCVFFALSYAYRQGANIRVTMVVRRLPSRINLGVAYLVQIFSTLFGLTLAVTTFLRALRGMHDGLMISRYNIPLGPAYLLVPIALFFMTCRMALDIRQVKEGKSGLFKEGEEDLR